MPIHSAGPRLFRSIKFQHLAKSLSGGGRTSNISLNLTPFVDMMTILVTFLLMVFSASGEILRAHQGLELPLARSKAELQRAPTILVTETSIVVLIHDDSGTMPLMKDVGAVRSLLDNPPPTLKIDALHEILKSAYDSIHNNVAVEKGLTKEEIDACKREQGGLPPVTKGDRTVLCPDGLALVQADKKTDARIISMVVNTARQAGFDKLLFAIKYDSQGGPI
jgi:biopolymer transport protein ExbD